LTLGSFSLRSVTIWLPSMPLPPMTRTEFMAM